MKYLAIIEKSETGLGAYVPDLPGCIAVAETEAEVKELIEEAIAFHIEGLREAGEQVPPPSSNSIFVDVKAG
jgi:predicted RNase H-like HicB family nuclease